MSPRCVSPLCFPVFGSKSSSQPFRYILALFGTLHTPGIKLCFDKKAGRNAGTSDTPGIISLEKNSKKENTWKIKKENFKTEKKTNEKKKGAPKRGEWKTFVHLHVLSIYFVFSSCFFVVFFAFYFVFLFFCLLLLFFFFSSVKKVRIRWSVWHKISQNPGRRYWFHRFRGISFRQCRSIIFAQKTYDRGLCSLPPSLRLCFATDGPTVIVMMIIVMRLMAPFRRHGCPTHCYAHLALQTKCGGKFQVVEH